MSDPDSSDSRADAGSASAAEGETGSQTGPRYADRLDELATRAARDRETFEPPENPPDEERAMAYLREGLGPLVALYLDARTGEWSAEFAAEESAQFHRAANTWLSLYAGCYGHDTEFDVAVRKAAEVLIQTENIRDTAQLLTRVPPRGDDHTNS